MLTRTEPIHVHLHNAVKPAVLPIEITNNMPIVFNNSLSDELFPKTYPASIFNED